MPSSCSGECAAEVLGTVEETDSQHRRRHENFSAACTRCLWDKFGKCWAANHGAIPGAAKDQLNLRSWSQIRPLDLGGAWALGCQVCFLASQCPSKKIQRRHQVRPHKFRKFSKYAVRGNVSRTSLREHASSAGHRRALAVFKKSQCGHGSPPLEV